MCGIVGYWDKRGAEASVVERMADQLSHRGPDDEGLWLDDETGLALAHRRLSIIDPSPAGHQPMVSPCGRYVLIYNGEIYNHQNLRTELEVNGGNFDWRGHSDSETLLASLLYWGVEDGLKHLNGMFAFALWDKAERVLFLARDRIGEKPLYYGCSRGSFLFGSELKSFTVHPQWTGEIDRDSLTLYMRHKYVPAPRSIYRGICKLQPAHYVVVREKGKSLSEPQCYWNLGEIAEAGSADNCDGAIELIDELDLLLRDAVKRRMAADVPLGAFLSGGFDSTVVAALMQTQSQKPIKTFTIGFHEKKYDEAAHARAVANHLGTNHTELYVSPEEAMAVIPGLPVTWDEPFSDSSQIPVFLVSQLARKHVTVSLSGDGGDELFCGYKRYIQGFQTWRMLRLCPFPLRQLLGKFIHAIPSNRFERLLAHLSERIQVSHLRDRLDKIAGIVQERTEMSYYHRMVSHSKNPAGLVLGGRELQTIFSMPEQLPKLPGMRERMMYIDSMTYLPDDILTKVDRASMAVSLEARVPLLDHRVVEFASKVPISCKFRDGKGKWLLREVLNRYVPQELMDRPKMGFKVPIEHWLRGPLRDWAEAQLSEKRLREEGFLNPEPIREMWREYISNKRRYHYHLWDVLMFQSWLEQWKR